MQMDETTMQRVREEIKALVPDNKGAHEYTMDQLTRQSPVLAREVLTAIAHVNHASDRDQTIMPPATVMLGHDVNFGMTYGGTLRLDTERMGGMDLVEFRTVMQHEIGHAAEYHSRSAESHAGNSSPAQETQADYYAKEYRADWYADALSGVYSHLKAVQRKPEIYDPQEKSPTNPDRKSRMQVLISELLTPGAEVRDIPQSGDAKAIIAGRMQGNAALYEHVTQKFQELDAVVKNGLTDASIDKFVRELEQSAGKAPERHSAIPSETQLSEVQRAQYALANMYLLNPEARTDRPASDELAPLYLKRQLVMSEAMDVPSGEAEKTLRAVYVGSRFDVAAYQQIVRGQVQQLSMLEEAGQGVGADGAEQRSL